MSDAALKAMELSPGDRAYLFGCYAALPLAASFASFYVVDQLLGHPTVLAHLRTVGTLCSQTVSEFAPTTTWLRKVTAPGVALGITAALDVGLTLSLIPTFRQWETAKNQQLRLWRVAKRAKAGDLGAKSFVDAMDGCPKTRANIKWTLEFLDAIAYALTRSQHESTMTTFCTEPVEESALLAASMEIEKPTWDRGDDKKGKQKTGVPPPVSTPPLAKSPIKPVFELTPKTTSPSGGSHPVVLPSSPAIYPRFPDHNKSKDPRKKTTEFGTKDKKDKRKKGATSPGRGRTKPAYRPKPSPLKTTHHSGGNRPKVPTAPPATTSPPKKRILPSDHKTTNHLQIEKLREQGMRLIVNSKSDTDTKLGVESLHQAADHGDVDAMYYLGNELICCTYNVGHNPGLGLELLERARDAGHVGATHTLGYFLIKGSYGVTQNIPRALALLKEAAKKGCVQSEFYMGYYLLTGSRNVPQNPARAVNYLRSAARQENLHAQHWLGRAYFGGLWGVSQSFVMGRELLLDAANKKHVDSMVVMGYTYLTEPGHVNIRRANEYLRGALDKNWDQAAALMKIEPLISFLTKEKRARKLGS